MNKFVLSAVAACALGFAGMSYAADPRRTQILGPLKLYSSAT